MQCAFREPKRAPSLAVKHAPTWDQWQLNGFIESKQYAAKQGVAAVAAGVDASEAVTEPRPPVTTVSHVSTREFMLEHHKLLQFFAYYAVMTVLTVQ